MPPKRPRRPGARTAYATKGDIAEIHRIFEERRQWLEKLEHTCSIQFERIAQMQAQLDEVRGAWTKRASPRPQRK